MTTPEAIKNYWNETYFKYWKEVTGKENRLDVPKEDACFHFFDFMDLKENDKVLEVGCGFGRLFPYFEEKKTKFYGIDISPEMIAEAKKRFPKEGDRVSAGDAESIDYSDEFFDKIFCWAVFDATIHQNLTLREFARVLKTGGKLIVSGKHKPYFDDDGEAIAAEAGAARKGHPNNFTNWAEMKRWLNENGLKVHKEFYFLRRGDMANLKYETKEPEKFYEYVIVLEKKKVGKVRVVMCMDTEGPATDARQPAILDSWEKIKDYQKKLFSEEFRNTLPDSNGNSLKISWFCLSWAGFGENPVKRDLGYTKVYDFYNSNWINEIRKFGDDFYWHYHHPAPSKVANEWNTNWVSNEQYNDILAHLVLERAFFPSVIRTGGTMENNDTSTWIEQWIPFDFGNRAGSIDYNKVEADGRKMKEIVDWSRAKKEWTPYNPDKQDYQSEGNMKRTLFKSLDLYSGAYKFTEEDIEEAFQQASTGKDVVLSAFEHDFRDINSRIKDIFIPMLRRVSERYPQVKFEYTNALEAAQKTLGIRDKTSVKFRARLNKNRLMVESNKEIFGSCPFLAIELKNGEHKHYPMNTIGLRKWSYNFEKPEDIKAIGLAANDRGGNAGVYLYLLESGNLRKIYPKTPEVLAVIPARGGSKGLPRKNILPLSGKPMIAHVIDKIKSMESITRLVVSTEDEEIAEISRKYGAEVPFMRPAELASDTARVYDVLINLFEELKKREGYEPDILVLLQAVSPFVKTEQINSAIKKLAETGADVVYSVCKADYPPFWMQTMNGDKPVMLFKDVKLGGRQDAPDVYKPTGAFYVAKVKSIINRKENLPMFTPRANEDTRAIITDDMTASDIDNSMDLKWVEFVLKEDLIQEDEN